MAFKRDSPKNQIEELLQMAEQIAHEMYPRLTSQDLFALATRADELYQFLEGCAHQVLVDEQADPKP